MAFLGEQSCKLRMGDQGVRANTKGKTLESSSFAPYQFCSDSVGIAGGVHQAADWVETQWSD